MTITSDKVQKIRIEGEQAEPTEGAKTAGFQSGQEPFHDHINNLFGNSWLLHQGGQSSFHNVIVGSQAEKDTKSATHIIDDLTSFVSGDKIAFLDGTHAPTSNLDFNNTVWLSFQSDNAVIDLTGGKTITISANNCFGVLRVTGAANDSVIISGNGCFLSIFTDNSACVNNSVSSGHIYISDSNDTASKTLLSGELNVSASSTNYSGNILDLKAESDPATNTYNYIESTGTGTNGGSKFKVDQDGHVHTDKINSLTTDGDLNLSPNGSGDVNITSGNVVMASGKGIDFNTNGTTLDDYEEGTWTPSITSGWTGNQNSVAGQYTKIGNIVFVSGSMDVNSGNPSAVTLTLSLPFTPTNGNARCTMAIYLDTPYKYPGTVFSNVFSGYGANILFYYVGNSGAPNYYGTTGAYKETDLISGAVWRGVRFVLTYYI